MPRRILSSRLLDVDAQRICLIKPSALGDVIQTLPLLPILRERFPHAEISWVVGDRLTDLLDGHPHLDRVIRFEQRRAFGGWIRLLRELRQREFDLVFDLQGLLRTAVMTAATRAPLRIGLETAREGSHLVCHGLLHDSGRLVPAHIRYWRVAEAIGMGGFRRETIVPIRQDDRNRMQELLRGLSGPMLAIHPGARWVTKRWPVEKFAAVAAKAKRSFCFSFLILGSRSEMPVATHLERLLRRFVPSAGLVNLAGQTTLRQLAAALQFADVLLTNDSGPMHLAAGLGTPVVGIFTCTDPQRSGPPGDSHELISTQVSCAGSYHRRCPHRGRRHMACLEELDIERVWRGLVRLVKKLHHEEAAA